MLTVFSSFQESANTMAMRQSSVRPSGPSVCLSVNFCANRFFSQANGRIATKLAHDGLQVSVHPGCAQGQGQGQRSRDTRTFWPTVLCKVEPMSRHVVCRRRLWRFVLWQNGTCYFFNILLAFIFYFYAYSLCTVYMHLCAFYEWIFYCIVYRDFCLLKTVYIWFLIMTIFNSP